MLAPFFPSNLTKKYKYINNQQSEKPVYRSPHLPFKIDFYWGQVGLYTGYKVKGSAFTHEEIA